MPSPLLAGFNLGRSMVLFGSQARTTAQNAAAGAGDQNGEDCEYLHVIIDVTVDPAAASLTFTIQGRDNASGKYYDILVSAAIAAVGTTVLKVGPALTAAANLVANDMIPSIWRVKVDVANADSFTYSVGANKG